MTTNNEDSSDDLTSTLNQESQRRRTVRIRVRRNQPRSESETNMVEDQGQESDVNVVTRSISSNRHGAVELPGAPSEGMAQLGVEASEGTDNDPQQQQPTNENNGIPGVTISNTNGNTFVQTVNGPNMTYQVHIANNSQDQIANNDQARQQQGSHILRHPHGPRMIRLPPGSIPPGARQIRIPGVTSPIHGSNPNTVPRVNIPKLVPQPIPNKTRPATTKEDDELEEKYHCPICCDFLNLPSSCGNCSSRFCNQCLRRVANSPAKQAKCPACRSELTVASIVQDEQLIREMDLADIHVTCPDCGKRLKATLAREHETSCEYTLMRCKNASVGCSWHGARKNLEHHVAAHCHFERISGLVDQFRHTKADQDAAIIAIQQRQFMTNQMVDLNTSWIRKSLPSPSNIFDLLNLTYTASCTPAHFLVTSDTWNLFLANHGAQESRAALCNLLYNIPTIFNLCRTGVGGYRLLLSLNFEEDIQLAADQIVLGVLSFIPFLLLVLTSSSLIIDGKSSLKWSTFKVWKYDRKLIRDIATISLLTANILVIDYDGGEFSAVFLWIIVMLATVFFPPMILTILGLASGISEPTPLQVFCAGRCAVVISFALRHAALVGFIGLSPALDAALLLQLIRRNVTLAVRYDMVPIGDGIWSTLSNEALYGILATRFSIW
eukprot:CAMPEP_0194256030 /NCGR_PEP_ID=MMETSP0158-20130606/35840_1 /TAXON_ID=33649 /ORGANISM="Thalassionema nitzschioides, Strain L26-B" /LENGTH=664 /DNA_ID=CAMNT_0038994577 /DNA_START=17 /DNA_END=2008 /DNA_ORIENTATION=+